MLDIKKLVKVSTVRRFASQDIIFEEGDLGSEMFIILSGSVRVFISAPNGNKVEVSQLKAGDTFGEMALLEGIKRSATVQALEETMTVAVNESNFESVICQEPSLALRIMRSLSDRIRRQNFELAKYKDHLCPNAHPLDKPPITIVEIKEEHQQENPTECADFCKSIQHIEKNNKVALPLNHSAYLYDKKIICPVCGQTNDVKLIRSSKVKLKQVEPDYRQVYYDFDPLWYIVWVCPHCYYANFSADFPNISDRERKRIMELSSKVKSTFGTWTNHLSLTQVLTGYYLTLYWFQQTPTPDFTKLGKLWLRLSWLYNDVQEAEMSIAATKKALGYFINHLEDSTVKTTNAQDQYFYLLVGELSLKMGKIAEARNYFRQSIVIKGGNVRMKQQAQNRIQELGS